VFVVSVELLVCENINLCKGRQNEPIKNTDGNISVIINPKNENKIFGSERVVTININTQCRINPIDPTPAIVNS
jgi:hypothetical protein